MQNVVHFLLTKVRVQNSFHLIPVLCCAENFTESAFRNKDKGEFIWRYYQSFMIDFWLVNKLNMA